MKMIRRRIVDDINIRISDQLGPASIRSVDTVLFRLARGRVQARSGNRNHIDIAQTTHSLNVLRRNKAGSNQTHPDTFPTGHRFPHELSLHTRNIIAPCSTQLISVAANGAASHVRRDLLPLTHSALFQDFSPKSNTPRSSFARHALAQ
jgi:hypothetical protein